MSKSADSPLPSRPAIALPAWQQAAVYGSLALLLLSGAGWLWAHYGLSGAASGEMGEHPLAAWSLRLHGVVAYLSLLAAGSVLPWHVRLAWRLRRNRLSGSLFAGGLALLACTGLWLYYGVSAREAVSLMHWLLGLALPAALAAHVIVGRRTRSRR